MAWHPGLDDIEASAYGADTRARYAGHRFRDNREPSTRRLAPGADGRCWCGELLNHDWPGKTGGAPHPRVAPDGLLPTPAAWAAQLLDDGGPGIAYEAGAA